MSPAFSLRALLIVVLLLLLVLFSYARRADAEESQACEVAVQHLERAVAGNLADTIGIMSEGISPPRRDTVAASLITGVPILQVEETEMRLDGYRVNGLGLVQNLATLARNHEILYAAPLRRELYVWADENLPISRVDAAIQPALDEGYTIVLLALLPERELGPCPAGWEDECRRLEATTGLEQAVHMAEMSAQLISPRCPRLWQLWSQLPYYRAHQKGLEVQRRAPDALRECACAGVNMERMTYLMPELLGLRHRATGVVYTDRNTSLTVGEWMASH